MAVIADTSLGYPGTVSPADVVKWLPEVAGASYSVRGPGDLRVTIKAAADRTVVVAPGSAAGGGVFDTWNTLAEIALPSVPTAGVSQWFMIIARRVYGTKTTTLTYIAGTAVRALPARVNNPGTQDDQPLALVRIVGGQAAPAEIVDLRVWGSNGGLYARDDLVLNYMEDLGTNLFINGRDWRRILDGGLSPQWLAYGARTYDGTASIIEAGVSHYPDGYPGVRTGRTRDVGSLTIPDPGFPYHLTHVFAAVEFSEMGAGERWDFDVLWMDTFIGTALGGGLSAGPYRVVNTLGTTRAVGATTVRLRARRVGGAADATDGFRISPFNRFLRATISPAS